MQLKSTGKKPIVRVVAGLIVNAEGRGLIAKRSQEMSSPGLWEIPGGKIEPGESPKEALLRELMEELSVCVSVGRSFAKAEAHIAERLYVMEAFVCTLISGTCSPSEHEMLKWIGAEDVLSLSWAPLDVPMLPAISNVLRKRKSA